MLADLRFALRTLRRSPLFTIVAIASLALGIGANTAIFSLMDQLMLRKLPIQQPEQIVMLHQEGAHNGSNMGDRMHSYPLYQDLQQKSTVFSEVIARRQVPASLAVDGQTQRVDAELVSGNYFRMLGVKPALGRVFSSTEDDRVFRSHPVAVISHHFWLTRFAADKNVIGKKVLLNDFPFTIVGVSAPGFLGLDPARSPQVRVPILMQPVLTPEWTWLHMDDRRTRWLQVFARLKPGHTAESAAASTQALFLQVRQYEMTLPAAAKWSNYARDQFMKGRLRVKAADTGYSGLRNSFSTALVVLMCMVGLVLLIACANVANLLIARAFARQKEIAVRLSIGASRFQLVRQLLVESLLISFAGGVAGIALAIGLTRGLIALVPAEGNPLQIQASPDARVLAFALLLTVLTGLVFGLLPALRASRPDLFITLKDAVANAGGSLFLRKGLVAAQVALSFLLLFGAGLFVRSLQNLQNTNTGFRDLDNLVTFQIAPALNGYNLSRTMQFHQDLLARLRAVPGVKQAALASVPVLHGWEWDSSISVEGHQAKDGEDMQAYMNSLSPGYFATMGIPLLEGRDFADRDMVADAKPGVAIVNQKFAQHYFPGRSAVGRRFGFGGAPGTKLDIEIIGVAADSLYEGPREGTRRQAFIRHYAPNGVAFYVRAGIPSAQLYPLLRREVKALDAAMPIYEVKTVRGQLDETLLTERLIALLSAGFGALATLLAAIGLYGVMAFVVSRRTKELGLRMALGASRHGVLWIVMREVLILVALGLAIGIPAAFAAGRYVSSQLYGLEAGDPMIALYATLALATVAGLAGFIPARRASLIDPMVALRYE